MPLDAPELSPEDYYLECGNLVFTAEYHRKRGYCCGSGCRHCPWRETADQKRLCKDEEPRDDR